MTKQARRAPASEGHADARGSRDPVTRAIQVLSWMADTGGEQWGLREMAKSVDMHPSTLYRVLTHLQHDDFVRQDARSGRYGLGLEFVRLAWRVTGRHTVRELALPYLRELVDATQETALLALYDPMRQEMLIAAVVESPQAVRHAHTELNRWMPIYAGAIGKAILAFLPEDERQRVLSKPLPPVTSRTVTDPKRLGRLLDEVRRQGYAVGIGERTPGSAGVAVPFFDADQKVLGALGVAGPEQRFGPATERERAALLKPAAARLTAQLGASAPAGTHGSAKRRPAPVARASGRRTREAH